MFKYFYCFLIPVLLFGVTVKAQTPGDSLKITLQEAEQMFLQKNLGLLAAKYSIDANKALIKQAKLWDNPILGTDQNVYDGKFFQHNKDNGQIYLQVSQLIKTAGKLKKAGQLAFDNTKISESQFNQLLQLLRFTLRSDFIDIHRLLKAKYVFTSEIDQVDKLVTAMDAEFKAGNIPLKDNMRIKALLFSLQNEIVSIESQLFPLQSEVKLLLQINDAVFVNPKLDYKLGELTKTTVPLVDSLLQIALSNRADEQFAKQSVIYQQHNIIYQKALAKPDVTIGMEYDRLSSYIKNYVGLAVSVPLNIFNRNQGNIKSAQYSLQSQQAQTDAMANKIQQDVYSAYVKLNYYLKINNLGQLDFSKSYDQLFQNMLKSYQDRQMNLLEFIDFMDAYKDTKLKLLDQHIGLVKSINELNYTTGIDVIKLN